MSTMTVQQLYDALGRLIAQGKGQCPVVTESVGMEITKVEVDITLLNEKQTEVVFLSD